MLKKGSQAANAAWDSIHVLEVNERGRTAKYKLTSTVILSLGSKTESLGDLDLAGNMTRQIEQDLPVDGDEAHVINVGRMVEDMELKMRNLLQEVYFGKAKDVVGDLRSESSCFSLVFSRMTDHGSLTGIPSISETNKDRATQREMINSMGGR